MPVIALVRRRGPAPWRRAFAAAVVLAGAIALAGCGASEAPTPPPALVPDPGLSLDNTAWRLVRYVGPDGALYTVPAEVNATLAFGEGGDVSGSTGCGTFTTTMGLGEGDPRVGQKLEVAPLSLERKGCSAAAAEVESAVLDALPLMARGAIQGGDLQLWDAEGKRSLVYARTP